MPSKEGRGCAGGIRPPLPTQFTVCVRAFVFTWARLHDLQPPPPIPPLPSGPAGPFRGTCSATLFSPPGRLRDRHHQHLASLLPVSPAWQFTMHTGYSQSPKYRPHSKDATRTRCSLDLVVLLSLTTSWSFYSETTAAMPCARHEDSVPLVAVAEALSSNPPFRCFEIFGATLPFDSNPTVPSTTTARWNWFSENLFTWLRQGRPPHLDSPLANGVDSCHAEFSALSESGEPTRVCPQDGRLRPGPPPCDPDMSGWRRDLECSRPALR